MLNAREKLIIVVNWLSAQDENLSYGLKSPEDAIKLWNYGVKHQELAEFCDENDGSESDWTVEHFKEAIGYCPFDSFLKSLNNK